MAILPVILFHANLGCPGGFVGVDVFFVISGFLITSLILKEINEGSFSLMTFWERRIRRIFPAMATVVVLALIVGWFSFFPTDFEFLGKSVVAQVLLLSNVFFFRKGLGDGGYFAPVSDPKVLLHTWSLAVEEQFYVLFPLLLIFLARHKRIPIPWAILWLGFASLVISIVGTYYSPVATFYLLPTRAWELMVGAFLAANSGWQLPSPRISNAAGFAGVLLILYSTIFYTHETRFPGLAAIPPCLGAALVILSGGGRSTIISRSLALKPVVFIGLISYSLYLWHWPLLEFAKYYNFYHRGTNALNWQLRVTLLLLSVVLSIASLKWIEAPFRKRLLCSRRPHLFALAGCSMVALLIFGESIFMTHGMPSRFPAQAATFFKARYDTAFRNQITPQQAAAGQFAELGDQKTNQPIQILLWGDSHAMSVAPALDELCRRFSVRGVEATHSATAPILKYVSEVNNESLHEQSLTFSKSVVDFIAHNHVETVVIAANWHIYGPLDVVDARLRETVQTILASGASVYVLRDVPGADYDIPSHAAFTVLRHGELARLNLSPARYAVANNDYEPILRHLSDIGATILDTPKYFLNTNNLYDVIRDGKILYSDADHLTVTGSKVLLPMFEPLIHQNATP